MKKIHLTLILIVTLWNALSAGSPFRSLFDLAAEDPGSGGGVVATEDPEDGDSKIINMPPPQ